VEKACAFVRVVLKAVLGHLHTKVGLKKEISLFVSPNNPLTATKQNKRKNN
jgi:hypothetical protein